MRRSSAPSKTDNAAKRVKFSPPFLQAKDNNQNRLDNKCQFNAQAVVQNKHNGNTVNAPTRSTLDVLKLIENVENESGINQIKLTDDNQKSCELDPCLEDEEKCENQIETATKQKFPEDVASPDDATKYFSTVWCKLSSRKHKRWEGDAVLLVMQSSTILKDMDGKIIGRGSMHKKADLESLEEGSRIVIGSKEIEITGTILAQDYYSGRCFLPTISSSPTETDVNGSKLPIQVAKKFGAKGTSFCSKPALPKFDPLNPDAFVLPRPDSLHQWKYNSSKKPVVDVVVDPVLSKRLRPHQKDGVIFLYECVMNMRRFNGKGAILADEMGLGKTLQCITLIWTLLKQGPYGGIPLFKRVLVITPSSLIKNWLKEFNTWLGRERITVCAASQSEQIEMFAKVFHYPILITSYELMLRHHKVLEHVHFDMIVCDEGHRLKNTTTKTFTVLASLPIQRRIVLTGTPIQNDLQEFFALVQFCNPDTFESISSFRKLYEEPILLSRRANATAREIQIGEARRTELTRLTSLFILRRNQDINNKYLPSKVEYVVFCKPSQLQLSIYRKILKSVGVRNCLNGVQRDGSFHLICISALKKLCGHPSLIFESATEASNLHSELSEESPFWDVVTSFPPDFQHGDFRSEFSGKFQVLFKLLESLHLVNERVVIVSISTKVLDLLEKMCQRYNYSFLRLDGSTLTSQRQMLVDRFNASNSTDFVFLLSSKAGGVGLNLIGASRIVLLDVDWNPANDLQAMSRVWREGQKKRVHIYRLMTAGTIEEKIYQRQLTKHNLSGDVIDSKDNKKTQFTLEELKDLFTLNLTCCNTHDLLACYCCVSEAKRPLRERQANNLENLDRICQLSIEKPFKKSKNLSMDELMSWEHIPGEALTSENLTDSYLSQAKDYITFLFYNNISTTSL